MTNTSIFWKISLAFTILIISQSIFIVNLWSNRWYTAENVKGKDGLTYTLLVGLSSNCIENNQRHKPYCTTLSTNLDQFKTFGLEFSLPSNLLTLLYACKIIYFAVIALQSFVIIGIIGICRNIDSKSASSSDILFTLTSITNILLQVIFFNLLIFGNGARIGVKYNNDEICSTYGSAVLRFIISLVISIFVILLMVDSIFKTLKNFKMNKGNEYLLTSYENRTTGLM